MRWSTIVGALLSSLAVVAGSVSPVSAAPAVEHFKQQETRPVSGVFQCGALTLTIVGGTETELIKGTLIGDTTRLSIHRFFRGVTLLGSDGETYRAVATARAHFVLVAPNDDDPVSGHELITARFVGGPSTSPLSLREEFRFVDGVQTTPEITGSCDFA